MRQDWQVQVLGLLLLLAGIALALFWVLSSCWIYAVWPFAGRC
jgi:hypothetical protein